MYGLDRQADGRMNQLDFNLDEAIARRDEGIQQVAENNVRFLEVARETAKRLARIHGEITADDVRKVCPLEPFHTNAWGGLFRTKDWVWTGRFRKSALVQGHGNLQRVWRLRA